MKFIIHDNSGSGKSSYKKLFNLRKIKNPGYAEAFDL
jgi:hypothetical protein